MGKCFIKHKFPIAYRHCIFITVRESTYTLYNGLVWFVYLFIHSVTHVTLDTPITDYNMYRVIQEETAIQ